MPLSPSIVIVSIARTPIAKFMVSVVGLFFVCCVKCRWLQWSVCMFVYVSISSHFLLDMELSLHVAFRWFHRFNGVCVYVCVV
jgi:hypothetical protein